MTQLCEIKSLALYRNDTFTTLYIVASKIGETACFSGRIALESLPTCILDKYIHINKGSIIGSCNINQRKGKQLVPVEIDRYQLVSISNYEKTHLYTDLKCGTTQPE